MNFIPARKPDSGGLFLLCYPPRGLVPNSHCFQNSAVVIDYTRCCRADSTPNSISISHLNVDEEHRGRGGVDRLFYWEGTRGCVAVFAVMSVWDEEKDGRKRLKKVKRD